MSYLESFVAGYLHQSMEGISRNSVNGILLGANIKAWQIPRDNGRFVLLATGRADGQLFYDAINTTDQVVGLVMDEQDWLCLPPASIGVVGIAGVKYHPKHGILHFASTNGKQDVLVVDYEGNSIGFPRKTWESLPTFPLCFRGNFDMKFESKRLSPDDVTEEFSHFNWEFVITRSGTAFNASDWLELPIIED